MHVLQIQLPYMFFAILQPLMLYQLVRFVSDSSQPIGYGFLWAIVMTLAALCQVRSVPCRHLIFHWIVQAVMHHSYYFLGYRMGVRLRLSCSHLIYNKSLRLSGASLSQTTAGQVKPNGQIRKKKTYVFWIQIVNLISNDADKLDQLANFLHYIWCNT